MGGEVLCHYADILEGRDEPRFRKAARQPVDFSPDMETERLWEVHDLALGTPGAGRGSAGGTLLDLKVLLADRMLGSCELCERRCRADRSAGQRGWCRVLDASISSEFLHYGEEPVLVPSYTVFFAGCTFECAFCQNYDISQHPGTGEHFPPEVLARMLEARQGIARNVNWVGGDPTSNLPYILKVLSLSGTALPQVWNSNMYLTPESMRLLEGVVDLYLTDFKYGNDACASRLSRVEDYWAVTTRNHVLARQQGADMIVRHLVMPGHLECCTFPVLDWLAEHLPDAVVNVMAQYRPMYRAREHPDIARPLKRYEFEEAVLHARDLGLVLVQE